MAKTEPPATADVDEDPSEDTPADESEEQAQDDTPETPEQPKDDWEARYKELQSDYSKKTAELAILRRGEEPEDEDDASDEDEPIPTPEDRSDDRLERDSWELAEARYGSDAMRAFEAADRIARRAQTPADVIAAYEAYYDVRSGVTKKATTAPKAADKAAARDKAVQPRVDNNLSDAGPDRTDLESQFEEARKEGNLQKWVHAATTAAGIGSRVKR